MEAIQIERKTLMEIAEKVSALRDDMDAILEELEILLDTELMESIGRGKKDIEEGKVHSLDEFKRAVETE